MWRPLQRLRRHFGVAAPKLAVRTQMPVGWRMGLGAIAACLVAVMVWQGFDLGRVLGGFDSGKVEQERTQLRAELARLTEENAALTTRSTRLESELKVAQGMQESLSRQVLELQTANTQVKEEIAFLQRLISGGSKEGTVSIQRLQLEPEGDGEYRFQLLVVQGGTKGNDFRGQVQLAVSVLHEGGQRTLLTLPDEQPPTAVALKLDFKYYQRLEGVFRVPPGGTVRSVQARVMELGKSQPRATQTLNVG